MISFNNKVLHYLLKKVATNNRYFFLWRRHANNKKEN